MKLCVASSLVGDDDDVDGGGVWEGGWYTFIYFITYMLALPIVGGKLNHFLCDLYLLVAF